jgi:hypothetical protein
MDYQPMFIEIPPPNTKARQISEVNAYPHG